MELLPSIFASHEANFVLPLALSIFFVVSFFHFSIFPCVSFFFHFFVFSVTFSDLFRDFFDVT